MKRNTLPVFLSLALALLLAFGGSFVLRAGPQADPLPSWKDGPTRKNILDFVASVTNPASPQRVPVEERLAVFDLDGTLWCEQPRYVQVVYSFARVRALAAKHPEWKDKPLFQAVLEGDRKRLARLSDRDIGELNIATHTGLTTSEVSSSVRDWLATARHPRFKRPYTELVFQPMLELLAYLRANGFKTYIVSGSGNEFMRVFTEKAFGIPPEQVIGSSLLTKFEKGADQPVLVHLPQILYVDNGPGKPEAIQRIIGRRPLAAFGNSDGDLEMLQWTKGGPGQRFALLVHHDDAEREYAYDRNSQVGRLDKALDEAKKRAWTVVSMKNDWKTIFPR